MSPLLRRAPRSFFPRRRTSRATFRTQWIGFAGGTGVLPADTTIVLPLLTATQTTTVYALNQPTVIRVRGEIVATFNGAEVPPVQATIWMGMAVLDADDTLPGGNPDNPFNDAYSNDWMFHRAVYLQNPVAGDERNSTLAAVRFEIDVKSRRRIENGQALCLVVSNPPLEPPTGNAAIGVAILGRLLLHEFGR